MFLHTCSLPCDKNDCLRLRLSPPKVSVQWEKMNTKVREICHGLWIPYVKVYKEMIKDVEGWQIDVDIRNISVAQFWIHCNSNIAGNHEFAWLPCSKLFGVTKIWPFRWLVCPSSTSLRKQDASVVQAPCISVDLIFRSEIRWSWWRQR